MNITNEVIFKLTCFSSVLLAGLLIHSSPGVFRSKHLTKPAVSQRIYLPVVIENFDGYSGTGALEKAWYDPPHGGETIQTLDSIVKGGGKYALSFGYSNQSNDKFYSAICRVDKWNLSGTDAVQFWFKPDGSGKEMTFQFNIANSKGNNIHDLWEYKFHFKKGDTLQRVIVLPYADLKHNVKYIDSPNVSPAFKPESVIEVAMYIGGRNEKEGSGVYYFDEIVAINTRDNQHAKGAQ